MLKFRHPLWMGVTIARSVDQACQVLADNPKTVLLAGGTDLMVGVNRGINRLENVVQIGRIPELREWHIKETHIHLGAGMSYSDMGNSELVALLPALAQSARTVGSPQIRNAGTLGGNLATSSPAGDTIPVLVALNASIEIKSSIGSREVPISEFITGVKKNALKSGELISSVKVPILKGPQEFLKVGTRNAMVISVVSLALITDQEGENIRVGIGSASATPLRARLAEDYLSGVIDWDKKSPINKSVIKNFVELVTASVKPIDDHRSSAAYRRHAVGILAKRALIRTFGEEDQDA